MNRTQAEKTQHGAASAEDGGMGRGEVRRVHRHEEATYTPGPWARTGQQIHLPGFSESAPIARVALDPEFPARTVANATLIAAAPDLLAALEACALHLANTPNSKLVRGHSEVLSAAYAAIAKAKGAP